VNLPGGPMPNISGHAEIRMGGYGSGRSGRRLDWLRSPSRTGIRTCAAKVYDNPMEWGAPGVRLLDPARDNASTLRRPAMVVHLPSHRRTGSDTLPARRRIHFRITPGLPARVPLPARTTP
jgi:hypothetical protein